MHALIARLYPICRSITGDGVRETLRILRRAGPARDPRGADRHPGLRLDRAAGVEHPRRLGRRTAAASGSIDFRAPQPPRRELQHAGPRHGCASPSSARTSTPTRRIPTGSPTAPATTQENWGFCLQPAHSSQALPEDDYEVVIDTTLADGALTYGECLVPGDDRRRGAGLRPRLPPVARQRQPLGHRGGDRAVAPAAARRPAGSATASCSSPAPSARSPGWRATRPGSARSATGWSLVEPRRPRASCTTSAAAAATPRSTAPSPTCSAAAARTRSSTSPPTATTSGSTARRASTCPSAASRARPTASSPSTTPPPTTSTSSAPRRSPTRSTPPRGDLRRARARPRPT